MARKMLVVCKLLFNFIIVVLMCSNLLDAARILAYFPTPSISHQIAFRPLTTELFRRGHEVTVITPDPLFQKGEAPKNYTEIDVHDISYEKFRDLQLNIRKQTSFITQLTLLAELFTNIFEVQLGNEDIQKVLHKDKHYYDLILVEAIVRPALVLSHIFKGPLIQVSSLGATPVNLEDMGVPNHIFLYPTMIRKRIYNLTLWEKLKKLNIELWVRYIMYKTNRGNEVLKKHFGPEVPTLNELSNNIEMLFLNVHPIWTENIPVPPSVIFMGGIQTYIKKKLPEDLETYMNSSKHGVIYLSFGTNVRPQLIKLENRQKLINVLSKLPYDVLWKWDLDELPGKTDNIKISKWFPQADILRHPKVKLFITQGVLQSIDEAISAEVPLLGIPMLADQPYNIEKVVRFKIGLKINMESFTEEELQNAITTVINDESYKQNVAKLRTLMYDQPQSPLERAIWWTEHVLRHGGAKHLRAPAANMTWTAYYELELVLLILAVLTVTLVALYVATKLVQRFIASVHGMFWLNDIVCLII